MFGLFKKKAEPTKKVIEIAAPVQGKAVPSSEVPDMTFSDELLGKGMAIIPEKGLMSAPVDGEVSLIFETLHAVSFTSDEGVEVLVHVGLDTVELKGQFFKPLVEQGAKVKKGDSIMEFDMEGIANAGYQLITPVIICNTDDYADVKAITGQPVTPADTVLTITK